MSSNQYRAEMAILLAGGIFLSTCCVTGGPVHALDPEKAPTQYVHDVWNLEDGLPQISVLDMVQTRDGFLWLATYEGIVRFDGHEFATFDEPGTTAITNALFEDREGSLWIGTQVGLARLRDGELTFYGTADGLANNFVQTIHEDREGYLWIGTQKGLSRYRDGRFTNYHSDADGLAHNDVRALLEDRRGRLWIGTQKGLSRLEDGGFVTYTTADGLPNEDVLVLLEDRAERVWIGTHGGGLASFTEERFTVYTTRDGLASDYVTALCEDHHGGLWIGTQDGGLSRLYGGEISLFRVAEGFSDNNVKALLEDRERNLWIGTWTGGLNRLRDGEFTPFTARQGLVHDMVLPILEDRAANLWIGTQDGLSRLRDGRFTTYTTADGLAHNFVWALHEDRAANLWIGTQDGLSRWRDGRFTTYTTADGLAHGEVHAILEGRTGEVWIGTWGGGLSRLKDGRFTTYTTADGLAHDFVMALLEDRAGNLWIGTTSGLSRLRDGRFTTTTTADGLAHSNVASLYEDRDGTLWIGTDGGLNRWRDGELFTYTTADGLFNNRFFQILEDDQGNLWATCNQGVFRLAKAELEELADGKRSTVSTVAYGTADGMRSRECNGGYQPAGWKSHDGRLWFPTIRGAVVVDPARGPANELPPPVVIDRLVAGTESISLSSRRKENLALDVRDLEIHYAGLSYRNPQKVEFKYQLEGYDEDWVAVGTRRVAYYTNLPPRSYRFRVIASNDAGVWNETGATLEFFLRPAFYETWYFYLACVGAFVVLGRGLYRLGVRQLLRRNRELIRMKEELETKNAEVAAQNAELERFTYTVSHDLTSPIVTIQGFVGLLERDLAAGSGERVAADLQRIRDAARLMHQLLKELIELSRIGRVLNPPEEVNLAKLAHEAMNLVEGSIAEHGVDVHLASDLPVVSGDRVRLLEVFQNLIENAVRYMGSQERPRIDVGTSDSADETVCYVRDNGLGIDPAYHDRIFRLFEKLDPESEGTGIGLALVKRIVEFHGGRIWVESQGRGLGSTFFFTLPPGGARDPRPV